MKRLFAIAAASLALGAYTEASATVVMNIGGGTLQPDENLLFNNSPIPGLTIGGMTNQTDTMFTLTGGETLMAFGGQARVRSTDLAISSAFTYNGQANQLLGLDFFDPTLAFTSTEFRVVKGTATQLTLTFVDTDGEVFQKTFDIPKSGFFNAQAIDGQQIDYFSIAANGTLKDIRQVRVGGVGSIVGVIPEPSAWALMIMGFGGAGLVLRRRRYVLAVA